MQCMPLGPNPESKNRTELLLPNRRISLALMVEEVEYLVEGITRAVLVPGLESFENLDDISPC